MLHLCRSLTVVLAIALAFVGGRQVRAELAPEMVQRTVLGTSGKIMQDWKVCTDRHMNSCSHCNDVCSVPVVLPVHGVSFLILSLTKMANLKFRDVIVQGRTPPIEPSPPRALVLI